MNKVIFSFGSSFQEYKLAAGSTFSRDGTHYEWRQSLNPDIYIGYFADTVPNARHSHNLHEPLVRCNMRSFDYA